jgi:hypothetical protein
MKVSWTPVVNLPSVSPTLVVSLPLVLLALYTFSCHYRQVFSKNLKWRYWACMGEDSWKNLEVKSS